MDVSKRARRQAARRLDKPRSTRARALTWRVVRKRSASGPSSRISSARQTTVATVSSRTATIALPSTQLASACVTSSEAKVLGSVREQ